MWKLLWEEKSHLPPRIEPQFSGHLARNLSLYCVRIHIWKAVVVLWCDAVESGKDSIVFRRNLLSFSAEWGSRFSSNAIPAEKNYIGPHPRIFLSRYIHGTTWFISIAKKPSLLSVRGVPIEACGLIHRLFKETFRLHYLCSVDQKHDCGWWWFGKDASITYWFSSTEPVPVVHTDFLIQNRCL